MANQSALCGPRGLVLVLLLTASFALAPRAAADPAQVGSTSVDAAPPELRHVSPSFLAVEFGASVVLSGSLLLATGSPPEQCGWCASNGFDESVRDALKAAEPRTAASLSHVFSNAAAPALALAALVPTALARGRPSHALEDAVIMVDATILTLGVTYGAKRAFARERPAVHHGVVADTEYADKPSEWNQSFFSADTSFAFALGSSAATLSYLRGYKSAPWIVFAGAVIGTSTALLRVAADVHWATDVLAGAAVGTAVGIALPYTLHGRVDGSDRALTLLPIVARGQLGLIAGGSF